MAQNSQEQAHGPQPVYLAYPGSQRNLAAAQGYPGYQLPSNDLAPAVPAIQVSSFPGYHEQPVEPMILPPPQPPQAGRRAGKVIWLIMLILALIAAGIAAGYILYTRYL